MSEHTYDIMEENLDDEGKIIGVFFYEYDTLVEDTLPVRQTFNVDLTLLHQED